MKKEVRRKKICTRSKCDNTASNMEDTGGVYFCDYSPRYQEKYDIYEKAKRQAKRVKKEERKKLKKVVDNEKSL